MKTSVTLRALEESDLLHLRDWRNADWLRPYVREYRLLNMVNQLEWFKGISSSRDVAMFGILISGDLSGVCGLTNINWVNRTAEISIYIIPKQRGRGAAVATMLELEKVAFEDYNLHRLWAEVYAFNVPGCSLFDVCGYDQEGRMVQHVFKNGQYHDSLLYGKVK